MITLDFSLSVAIFSSLALALVLGRWIIYTYHVDGEASFLQKKEDLIVCPYCTHLFFDYRKQKVKICPRCESYVETDETKTKE